MAEIDGTPINFMYVDFDEGFRVMRNSNALVHRHEISNRRKMMV